MILQRIIKAQHAHYVMPNKTQLHAKLYISQVLWIQWSITNHSMRQKQKVVHMVTFFPILLFFSFVSRSNFGFLPNDLFKSAYVSRYISTYILNELNIRLRPMCDLHGFWSHFSYLFLCTGIPRFTRFWFLQFSIWSGYNSIHYPISLFFGTSK